MKPQAAIDSKFTGSFIILLRHGRLANAAILSPLAVRVSATAGLAIGFYLTAYRFSLSPFSYRRLHEGEQSGFQRAGE